MDNKIYKITWLRIEINKATEERNKLVKRIEAIDKKIAVKVERLKKLGAL